MKQVYSKEGKVWDLERFIYGLKNSPCNYLHMKKKFGKLDFYFTEANTFLCILADVLRFHCL